jgi:hypothetical protein
MTWVRAALELQGLAHYVPQELLPGQRSARLVVNAARRLGEPAGSHILAVQRSREAVPRQPAGIDDKPLGKLAF